MKIFIMGRIKYFLFISLLICSTSQGAVAATFGYGAGFWFIDWQEQTITGLQKEASDTAPFSIKNNKCIIAGTHLSHQSKDRKTLINTQFYTFNAVEFITTPADTSGDQQKIRPEREDFSFSVTRTLPRMFLAHLGISYSKYKFGPGWKTHRIEPQIGAGIMLEILKEFKITYNFYAVLPVSRTRYGGENGSAISIGYTSEIKASFFFYGTTRYTIGYRASSSIEPAGSNQPGGKSGTWGITFSVVYLMDFTRDDLYPTPDCSITMTDTGEIESFRSTSHW